MRVPIPRYAVAALSGVLLGIAVLPTDRIPLAHWPIFFGFVPLWSLWLQGRGKVQVFFLGWITQFVFTLIAFNWIAHTVHEFAFLSWPLSVFVLFLFCAVSNLYIPLAGSMFRKIFSAGHYGIGARVAGLVILTAIGERIFPMIFEWNLGYVWFFEGWPGFHVADVIGFRGLSTVSLMINGLLLYAWEKRKNQERYWPALAMASLFLIALNWVGTYRLRSQPNSNKVLKVLVVQANIGNKQKHIADFGEKYREAIMEQYLTLTEKALRDSAIKPDFVIWPENAFPDVIAERTLTIGPAALIKRFLADHPVPLVTGGYGFNGIDALTNSIFLLSKKGEWAGEPYRKTILLPFGEYMPGARFFPFLKNVFPHVRDFGAGSGPLVFSYNGVKVGLQICYEGLFDWFARSLAKQGAEVIVNVTNDSWYGTWQQPYQHFIMTMGRAVENRIPLLRATNTGISGVVLASGQLMEMSPLHQQWAHLYEIPYVSSPAKSPFARYGYWIVPGFLVLIFGGLMAWPFVQKKSD